MEETSQKIEVVNGTGKELEISDVSTHLSIAKPKIKDESEKKKQILIPEVKGKTKEKKKEN